MGKLKNCVEIIPIDGPSGMYPRASNFNSSTPEQRGGPNRAPYMMKDPVIVQRVRQYLETNVHKTYIDITEMADCLQNQYPEYVRRKKSAFRAMVKQAYTDVVSSYGTPLVPRTSSDSEIDCDDEDEEPQNNTMNDQLIQMYNRGQIPRGAPIQQINVMIDISSDDSADETAKISEDVAKASNGVASVIPPAVEQPPPQSEKKSVIITRIPSSQAAESPAPDRGKKRKLDGSVQTIGGKRKKDIPLQESSVSFKDIGGITDGLIEVCKMLLHIRHPEIYRQIGISPPRGFLLHGPPGCGKTLLANAIAGELKIPLLKVAAPELVGGISGESEERVRDLFDKAADSAPCLLFIDEIDAITQNRQQAQKEMERRIVAQLLSCLDDLGKSENGDRILVIGATNRPDSLDPALRRAGRFDREVCLGIPNVQSRVEILKVLTEKLKLAPDFDYVHIAKNSPGYVGADLMALTREAAMAAINRVFVNLKNNSTTKPKSEIKSTTPKTETNTIEPSTENTENTKKAETSSEKAEISSEEAETSSEIAVTSSEKAVASPEKAETLKKAVSSSEKGEVSSEEAEASSKKAETSSEKAEASSEKAEASSEKAESSSENVEISSENPESEVIIMDVDVVEEKSVSVELNAEPEMAISVRSNAVIDFQKASLDELISWLHGQAPLNMEQLKVLHITMDDFNAALKCVQPSSKREGFATVPDVTWDDVGSLQDIRQELQMTILAPVRYSEQFQALGLTTPTGVLLCGPPGCGKTLLAKAIANEAGINFISVKGPELLNKYVGESERAVRQCFQRARNSVPCVIFFDELDALCPKRTDSGEGSSSMRVVNQMLTEMDGVEGRSGVFLMAATNRPDIVDPAVLRPGRLDKILYVGLPSPEDRTDILRAITKKGTQPPLAPDVNLKSVGKWKQCEGYTGADLAALVREAATEAIKELMISDSIPAETPTVNNEHFLKAVAKIRPSVTNKDQKHYEKLRQLYGPPSGKEVVEIP